MSSSKVHPTQNMNSAIHRALRRDLYRLEAVAGNPMPDAQRAAMCRHVTWMMDFLHHHHVGEDEGVWPRTLAKRPDLQDLFEAMESEHEALAAASDRLRSAADDFARDGSDATRTALAEAVTAMKAATLPHLEHEENEAMPLIVATLDDADWAYLAKNHFRAGLTFTNQGLSIAWVLDDADAQAARVVRSELPTPILWLLTALFGRRYDRQAAARWGELAGTRA